MQHEGRGMGYGVRLEMKGRARTVIIHERRVLRRAVVRARQLQEPAKRVDLVLALEDRLVVHRAGG